MLIGDGLLVKSIVIRKEGTERDGGEEEEGGGGKIWEKGDGRKGDGGG